MRAASDFGDSAIFPFRPFHTMFFMQNCSECILASTPGEQYTINVHVCIIYM